MNMLQLILAAGLLSWGTLSPALAQQAKPRPNANSKPSDSRPLRVLSYNIHHGEGVDGKLDLQRIASVIQSVHPDIVALQEVDVQVKRSQSVDQAAELGKLTGMKHAFGGNIDLQGGKYGNAVLAQSALQVVANHRLPNIDNGEQRGVLEVTINHQGRPLRVLATHFDHRRDARERLESVAMVNELAATDPNAPALLVGDLNAPFDSDVLQQVSKAWQRTNSASLPTIPVAHPERQIDFILTFPANAWEVVTARVLDEAVASDHRAIFVELKLK